MAVKTASVSAVGPSPPIGLPMDYVTWAATQAGFSLLVNFSGPGSTPDAAATVDVQVSNDPLAVNDPTNARWNTHDVLNGLTADTNDTIIAPIYAARLNCTAYTSGTITLHIGYPS